MQRLVGVGDVDAFGEQRAREILAAGAVAFHADRVLVGLVPRVASPLVALPGLEVHGVVRENGKGGHAVLAKILVLIVAPDEHEVGVEGVELAADLAKLVDQVLAVLVGVRLALVIAPLLAHGGVPVFHRAKLLGKPGVLQALLRAPAHIALGAEVRVMGDAESEYLPHGYSPLAVTIVQLAGCIIGQPQG